MKSAADTAVAVVVLNHNRRDLLLECLASVTAQEHRSLDILVVDNGSSDGSADAVAREFPGVHLLRQSQNLGVAGGRNAGLAWVRAHLSAPYLLFIDNDTSLEPRTVSELLAATAADARIGLVAPKCFHRRDAATLASAGGMDFNLYIGSAWDVASGESDRGQHDAPRDIRACPGFAFFVKREVFEEIGAFDENFNPYGWEDVDLSLRAARAGFRLVYAPAAIVYHSGGRASRGPIRDYERHKAQKMIYLLRRHSTPVQWGCFLLVLPFRASYRAMREIATGHGDVVLAWLRGVLARNPRSDRIKRE